jgi:hypothetical protein
VKTAVDQVSPFFAQNLKCYPTWKLCPSKNWTTFILVEFEVFRWNSENAAKVLEGQGVTRGLTRILARVWPSFVHKSVLTWLGVSLALSKVIKHPRCCNLPPLKGISSRDSEIKDKGRGNVLTVSRLEKTRILGIEEVLGLPSSFFFSMVTPLYLVHLHGMSPSFSFFLI